METGALTSVDAEGTWWAVRYIVDDELSQLFLRISRPGMPEHIRGAFQEESCAVAVMGGGNEWTRQTRLNACRA